MMKIMGTKGKVTSYSDDYVSHLWSVEVSSKVSGNIAVAIFRVNSLGLASGR
jgi:hypothetical protein